MAEAENNRRRHQHHVVQMIALLEGEDLDPGDPALAAALARLGDALEAWLARHEATEDEPEDDEPRGADGAPDDREAGVFARVHALMDRAGVPEGVAVGDAIAAGLVTEEEVARALEEPDRPTATEP